jgi:hypothetical protein
VAALTSTTLRSTALQDQVEILPPRLRLRDRILRHDAAVVFDIYVQIFIWQHVFPELEDFREPVRAKSMLGVIADVRL